MAMACAMACSCKIETDLGDARNGQNPHLWMNTGFRVVHYVLVFVGVHRRGCGSFPEENQDLELNEPRSRRSKKNRRNRTSFPPNPPHRSEFRLCRTIYERTGRVLATYVYESKAIRLLIRLFRGLSITRSFVRTPGGMESYLRVLPLLQLLRSFSFYPLRSIYAILLTNRYPSFSGKTTRCVTKRSSAPYRTRGRYSSTGY